ncbi:MAG: sigma factor-like helix-turn-helix DNA-binding protein [Candidatus Onthoplasma sp.]
MNLNERVEFAILNKYYGKLLTDRQQSIISMYVDNNLSLAEVSEELKISRQAVKDSLDKSLEMLKNLEEKLKFKSRDENLKKLIEEKTPNQIDMVTKNEIISILEE